jgi:hypothetical protein
LNLTHFFCENPGQASFLFHSFRSDAIKVASSFLVATIAELKVAEQIAQCQRSLPEAI